MPDECFYFGKHKHKPLAEVPDDYLEWVILNIGKRKTVGMAIKELDRRGSAFMVKANIDRPEEPDWRQEMAKTHYQWAMPSGEMEWIPNGVDMTGREYEEPSFDVEPWDTIDEPA